MNYEQKVNASRLNDARWAASNTRWIEGHVPTMEKASEVADNAVRAYLGIDEVEWEQLLDELDSPARPYPNTSFSRGY